MINPKDTGELLTLIVGIIGQCFQRGRICATIKFGESCIVHENNFDSGNVYILRFRNEKLSSVWM